MTNRNRVAAAQNENCCGVGLTGWQLWEATGVSDDGLSIVGYGRNPDGNTEAWLTRLDGDNPVPAPATLFLMVAGFGAMAAGKRRKT
jgi:hypothetical protein